MKKDLTTAVIASIAGFIIAYFVTNLIYPVSDSFSIKTIGASVDASIATPSEDIFNFRSINPTVEVYVGQCKEYNANGDCVDGTSGNEEEDTPNEDENNGNNNSNSNNNSLFDSPFFNSGITSGNNSSNNASSNGASGNNTEEPSEESENGNSH